MKNVAEQLVAKAVGASEDRIRGVLVRSVTQILSVVDQVNEKGRKAELPRGGSYNHNLHELTLETVNRVLVMDVLKLAIKDGLVAATEVRPHWRHATKITLSLQVV